MCGALFTIKQEKSIKSLVVNAKTLVFLFVFSALAFHMSFAHAELKGDVILAAINTKQSVKSTTSYPKLFGRAEQRYSDISAFTKWSDMFTRFQGEVKKPENVQRMKKWGREIQSLKGKSFEDKLSGINTFMNNVKFVPDTKNWGKRDYWATPLEFMKRGGDCEDYAIAKYVSLRALGVEGDKMRIAIVQDQILQVPHAVLVVYEGKKVFILDNQNDKVLLSNAIKHYKPVYSISQTSWWRH